MLTLKEPLRLQCEANLITVQDSFGERIRGNYSLFPASVPPKDLLLLLTAPPELPEESHDMTMLVNQSSQTIQTGLTFDIVNNIVNRILLTQQTPFTYQDTVYISQMLQRLGITDVAQFMRQVRQVSEEARHIRRLTAFYQTHYTLLQQAAPAVSSVEGGSTAETAAPAPTSRERYFLHNDIYRRLQTAAVYHTVSQFATNTASVERAVSFREMRVAEQAKVSMLLRLGELRQQTVDQEASLTLQHVQNHYERGDLLPPPETETQVFTQLAEAALLDIVSKAVTFLSMRNLQQSGVWLQMQQAIQQSVDNTIFRFEQWHQQIPPRQGDTLLAEESRNTLYQQELSLLQKLVNRITQSQQTVRQGDTSLVAQTQQALTLLAPPETTAAPSPELPPFVLVQALREVLFTERAAFAPTVVLQQAVEQLTQRILPLIEGQPTPQAGRGGVGGTQVPSRLLLQHDLAQTETAFLLEQFDQLDTATRELLERHYQQRLRERQEKQQELRLEDVQTLLAETLATVETQQTTGEQQQQTETEQQRIQHTQFNRTARTVIDQLLRLQEELGTETTETIETAQPLRPAEGETVQRTAMKLLLPQAATFRDQLAQLEELTPAAPFPSATPSAANQPLRLREQFDALDVATQARLERAYQTQRQVMETTQREWTTETVQQLLRETVEILAAPQLETPQPESLPFAAPYRQLAEDVQQAFTTLQQARTAAETAAAPQPPVSPETQEPSQAAPPLVHPVAATEAAPLERVAEQETFPQAQTFREQLIHLDRLTQTLRETPVLLREQFDSFEPSIQTLLEQHYQTQRDTLRSRQQEWTTETVQRLLQETIQAVAFQQKQQQETETRQRVEQTSQLEHHVREALTTLHQVQIRLAAEAPAETAPSSVTAPPPTLVHPAGSPEATQQEILAELEADTQGQTLREQLTRLDRLTQTVETAPVLLREQFDALDEATQTLLERHYQTQRETLRSQQTEWNTETLRRVVEDTLHTVATQRKEWQQTIVQQRTEQESQFQQSVQQALTTLHQIQEQPISVALPQPEPAQAASVPRPATPSLVHPTEAIPPESSVEATFPAQSQTFREQLMQIDRLTQTLQTERVLLREQFDQLTQSTQTRLEQLYQARQDELRAQQQEFRLEDMQRILAETWRTMETHTTEQQQRQTAQQRTYQEREERLVENIRDAIEQTRQSHIRLSQAPERIPPAAGEPGAEPPTTGMVYHETTREQETETHTQTLREQLDQIDRRNREMIERVRQAHAQERQIQRTEVRRGDTGRTIDDALRALEDPDAVMQELLARPAPKPSQPILSPEVQLLLQQADEPTRRMLETVMQYEANPAAVRTPLQFLEPQAFNAETQFPEAPPEAGMPPRPGAAAPETEASRYPPETWPDLLHPAPGTAERFFRGEEPALSPFATGEPAADGSRPGQSPPPSPEAVAASLAATIPQETLIHEAAQELIRHPAATPALPAVQTADWSPMRPLRFIHKTEPSAVTEELIEQLEQHRETLQRSTQTEQSEQIERRETIAVHNQDQTLQRTIERTTEDVTELINRTLARQLGTISDKVYNQIEKRLRLERARRGR